MEIFSSHSMADFIVTKNSFIIMLIFIIELQAVTIFSRDYNSWLTMDIERHIGR